MRRPGPWSGRLWTTTTAATVAAAGVAAEAKASPAPSRSTARAPWRRSRRPRQEAFQAENPDVKVTVGTSGTGGGFEKFCAGETDISDASRPIKDDEEAPICKKEGIKYDEVQVANDGIAVVTNPDLKVELPDRRPAQEDLEQGLEGEEPERGRSVAARHEADAVRARHGLRHVRLLHRSDQRRGRRLAQGLPARPSDDNVLVQGVSGAEGGLGYFGFSYYEQNKDKLDLVGSDERRQAASRRAPRRSRAASTSRSRGRCSCTRARSRSRRPEVKAFMDYVDRELPDDRQGIADRAHDAGAGRTRARRTFRRRRPTPADGSRQQQVQQVARAVPVPRGGAPPLGRGAHQGAAVPRGADLGPHDHRDRDRAARARRSTSSARSASGEFLSGGKWTPLFEPAELRRAAARDRHLPGHRHRAAGGHPARARAPRSTCREYAQPRVRKTIKPILELLAGVPTIVFGYFALTFFTPNILQDLVQLEGRRSSTRSSAGIIMGFMIIPTIASVSEDAMSAVPQSLREGAFGLGASKLQVSAARRVPGRAVGDRRLGRARRLARGRRDDDRAARGRARGEQLSLNPTEPHAVAGRVHRRDGEGDRPPGASSTRRSSPSGMTLFVITLIMNLISIRFVRKYRQVYE